MGPDIGDITADHSPASIHIRTEAATLEGTPCTLLPATAAAHAALQPTDTPIIPHAMITNWHSCIPSCTHHFSCRHHSHHSMDWGQSHSRGSHHAAQDSQSRNIKQCPRPSTPYKTHCPKTVTIQGFSFRPYY